MAGGPGIVVAIGGSAEGLGYFDVFEYPERVRDQDSDGVVGTDQVGDHGPVVDAHEPDIQPGLVLIGDARLVQAYHALILFAGPHRDDRSGMPVSDGDLVT